jgi:hypothetical protein
VVHHTPKFAFMQIIVDIDLHKRYIVNHNITCINANRHYTKLALVQTGGKHA